MLRIVAASLVLVKLVDLIFGFITDPQSEVEGLDRTEHEEVGFDLGPSLEESPGLPLTEPRSAIVPPNGEKRFTIVVEGARPEDLIHAWSELCQVGTQPPAAEFCAVYPFLTTVQHNRFRFRGGDPNAMKDNLQRLFQNRLRNNAVRAQVESN